MGKTIVFEKTFQTTATDPDPPIAPPAALPDVNMAITAVEVVGLNKIRVSFDCENLLPDCSATLYLTKDNLTETDVLALTSRDLSVGFVEMPVDSNISTLSILPSITYDDGTSTMDFEPYQHTFDNTLECDIQVVVPNNSIVFDLKAISGDGVITVVVDLDTNTILTEWELAWEGEIISTSVSTEFSPDTPTVNYGVYITDANGQKTSTDFVAEVKTSVDVRPEFTFNYKNPGDVGITYNNDGTINTYIATDFQCDNPDVYYQVTLGDLKFISRDQIFCGLNLPDETYSLTYDVCIDQNGVQYSLFTVSPSGTVNELRADSLISYEYMNTDFDLTLFVFSYYADRVDRDVVRIVSSTGEEIILTESNWVFNEDAGEYTCVVHFDQYFDYADIYVVCSPTANIIESYGDFECVGSVSKEFIVRIYT
jgi:hypothetical protein